MTISAQVLDVEAATRDASGRHPLLRMVAKRAALGVLTVWLVSVLVYWATLILPGNAATAILGQNATPARLAALKKSLHLDESPVSAYLHWITGILTGASGKSLVNSNSVASLVWPRMVNSMVLVVIVAILSTLIGMALGVVMARNRDSIIDHATSSIALAASALPEFVVAVFVVLLFSVKVFHWFPGVSTLNPGQQIWDQPSKLVLPVVTLLIVVTPYTFRMMRAAMIDALNSDYVEMAELKGIPSRTVLLRHALPNALGPTIAVVGLNILYLAGGIVLVEAIFNYPGVGLALVDAVSNRDVPVIQFIVLILAVLYVVLNVLVDIAVLLVTPRRRTSR